jgi:hypothetical protein
MRRHTGRHNRASVCCVADRSAAAGRRRRRPCGATSSRTGSCGTGSCDTGTASCRTNTVARALLLA